MHFTNIAKWLSVAGLAAAAEYDYIVVGGGPSGIITAERLSAENYSVLLLERGQGPTVDTGSNKTLSWDDQLTYVDVPGLSASLGGTDLWPAYTCKDTTVNAACVLGGGTTINYMVFVHPSDHDFDDKWPKGWQWSDIESASERLYERNSGTTLPSADGERYAQGLYNSLSKVLERFGFHYADMIEKPNDKHEMYSHPAWNIKDQLRAGPLRTYLPLAKERNNFELRTGSKVLRVVRDGATVTGVEVETANGQNSTEVISLSPNGRVVLAAGAVHSPRLLWNSGIGRAEQIEIAANSGIQVPARDQWINLPVGEGLKDHPIFTIKLNTEADFAPLDAEAIVNGTATADIQAYEDDRSGFLTEGKHELIFFTSREDKDGSVRYFQGSCASAGEGVLEIKVYLTHGLTSSGTLGLQDDQTTYIADSPYLTTEGDEQTVKDFIAEMLNKLQTRGTGYSLATPTNVSAIIEGFSSGTHYVGTTKLGPDSGLENGTSVVDLNTKVYGTDNLFIVDAGIHPDLPTGNVQTTVMVVAEAAVAKILAAQ